MSVQHGNDPPQQFEQKHEKKKFDKKKFWNMKFNNKVRVQQWEERRQKYVMRKYHKELKKNRIEQNSNPSNRVSSLSEGEEPTSSGPFRRLGALKSAQLELERRKEVQRNEREAKLSKKKEMQEAMEKYKKRKAEKFRKLSKKTKRGQPVMKDRLQLLFEEIKQTVSNEGSATC